MAVALYLRVSTEEQRERQSIATQHDFALRYCALHQLTIHQTYADDGVSGTVPVELRPLGARLLEDARQHQFDQLLVFKLDRLGRDTRLILNTVAELEKHGVRVRSMTEEFDTATSTGRLMLTLLSGFAAHERELIRERSMAGTNRLAETGAWLGGVVPYGYRKQGDRNASRLVLSEEPIPGLPLSEAAVIEAIFRLCATETKCFAWKTCVLIPKEAFMWTAREDRRSKGHMTNDPNDPVLPLGKSSVIVEIAGETPRFRVYTATLIRRGRRRIGLRFDGPQGSVTIEFPLVTFWQLTETFHEQSIARQE